MKIYKLISCVLIFMLATACNSNSSTSNIDINDSSNQIVQFDSVDNIRNNIDTVTKKISNNEYNNIHFKDNYLLNIPNVDSVCSISAKYGTNTVDDIREYTYNLAKYCYDDVDFSNVFDSEFAISYSDNKKMLFVNKEKSSLDFISESMFDFNSTYLQDDITVGLSNYSEEEIAYNKAIDLIREYKAKPGTFKGKYITTVEENIPDIKFDIGGTKVSILEAKKLCENFYNNMPKLYDWYEYICSDISVYLLDNNEYIYVIDMSASYNGLPIDNTHASYGYNITNPSSTKIYTGRNESCLLIDVDDKKPDLVRNYILGIEINKISSEVTDIITLDYAINSIQDLVSKYIDFTIESIELIYSCTYDENINEFIFQPSWKIKGTPYTDSPAFSTTIFIDAINGEQTVLSFPDLQR